MIVFANVLQPLIDLSEVILRFFHDTVGFGWGLSIVFMTFTIRLAILPLTFKMVKGMNELQRLQPEMKRIQERYKDDKQRMQQEVMKLYQEHQINPLSSCFPLLIQLPFFLALFYLLRDNEDIAGQSFLFIPDLAAIPAGTTLVALLVLYVGTQLGASAVSAATASPSQRWLLFGLPFFFLPVILLYDFPSGLLVYWITTNVWTVGQQVVVRKLYPKPEPIQAADGAKGTKPARGKPAGQAAAVSGDGKDGATATAAVGTGGGNGGPRKAPPPRSPRKKKKRSGRRR